MFVIAAADASAVSKSINLRNQYFVFNCRVCLPTYVEIRAHCIDYII